MAEDVEFRRNAGSPDQLPMGEATELNESLEDVSFEEDLLEEDDDLDEEDDFEEDDETELPLDVEFDESPEPDSFYKPRDDIEKFLFAPGGGITPSTMRRSRGPVAPSRSVIRALPALGAAAADPSSPPIARALYRHIVDLLRTQEQV